MDFEKLKAGGAAAIIGLSSAPLTVMVLMFLTDRPLFLSIDTFKLIFLSMGIAFPLIIVNFVLDRSTDRDRLRHPGNEQIIRDLAFSGAVTTMNLSVLCVNKAVFPKATGVFLAVLLIILTVCNTIFSVITKKKTSSKTEKLRYETESDKLNSGEES